MSPFYDDHKTERLTTVFCGEVLIGMRSSFGVHLTDYFLFDLNFLLRGVGEG
jgi:hypothetical protein